MHISANLSLEDIQASQNVATLLDEKVLDEIGREVVKDYDSDLQSRSEWEDRMESAMDLALQIVEEKHYPWPNASNVKFPLLTIASLQFASRAYPALVKAPDLVKYRVQGKDEGGVKAARAQRISEHMSYQLLEQDEAWEEDQDKAFLALPILGCIFKKSYYDPVRGHNCSKLVLPKYLVVHYFAKCIEDAERKTEYFSLYDREIRERELRGIFTEHDYGPNPVETGKEEDKRQGLTPPMNDKGRPRTFLEQHTYIDLDGDGYKEPYVVTVDKASRKVARIVHRFGEIVTEQSIKIEELQNRMQALVRNVPQLQSTTPNDLANIQRTEEAVLTMRETIDTLAAEKPKVLRIKPVEHYTKYSFIPSPDGGFYDLGFGCLLGPVNNSVNTLINQLVDAGTLQNGSMGFIGKGARIKGGKVRFSPFEWKRVDVAGSSLKDSLVPLPVNEPSNVLFQLLSLLISYAERVGSVTDAMVGENPGQNTPAYNMSAMLEQGLQVFNGIFKRVYRSFRSELRKLYNLNSIYLEPEEYFSYQDADMRVLQADYTADPKDLIPAADPNAFSNKEKLMKAQAVREAAMTAPGYDPIKVEQRLLEALDIPDAAEIFPLVPEVGEDGQPTGGMTYKFPPQPDPEFEIKRAEEQRRALESHVRGAIDTAVAEADIMVKEAQVIKLMADAQASSDEAELKKFELILKELSDRRKALVDMAKIDATKQSKQNSD